MGSLDDSLGATTGFDFINSAGVKSKSESDNDLEGDAGFDSSDDGAGFDSSVDEAGFDSLVTAGGSENEVGNDLESDAGFESYAGAGLGSSDTTG